MAAKPHSAVLPKETGKTRLIKIGETLGVSPCDGVSLLVLQVGEPKLIDHRNVGCTDTPHTLRTFLSSVFKELVNLAA